MNKMMTLLASVMLLASACTGKQASEKTASGLEPANFRTEVDGKQTDLFVLENNLKKQKLSVYMPEKKIYTGKINRICVQTDKQNTQIYKQR